MATTSTVNMFYIGNFADMDTDESNASNENPNAVLGTHDDLVLTSLSEVDGNSDGVMNDDEFGVGDYLTYDIGGGATKTSLDSSSLYNAEILLGDGSTMSAPVLVIQGTNGDVFVTEWVGYPLDNLAIQSISLESLNTSNAKGYYADRYDAENTTVVCYAPGVQIETPFGDRAVETLRPGDLVASQDNGPQPILWVRSSEYSFDGARCDKKPVLIQRGALGPDRPVRDLVVSPQHRVLVGGMKQLQGAFDREVFVPAKALTRLQGIRHMNGKSQIRFIQFACLNHEVVKANGCMSETLLLGPMVLKGLSDCERRAVAEIFPRSSASGGALNGPAARTCLPVEAARRALEKHLSRKKQSAKTQRIGVTA